MRKQKIIKTMPKQRPYNQQCEKDPKKLYKYAMAKNTQITMRQQRDSKNPNYGKLCGGKKYTKTMRKRCESLKLSYAKPCASKKHTKTYAKGMRNKKSTKNQAEAMNNKKYHAAAYKKLCASSAKAKK